MELIAVKFFQLSVFFQVKRSFMSALEQAIALEQRLRIKRDGISAEFVVVTDTSINGTAISVTDYALVILFLLYVNNSMTLSKGLSFKLRKVTLPATEEALVGEHTAQLHCYHEVFRVAPASVFLCPPQ